jgi:hypothetical protein
MTETPEFRIVRAGGSGSQTLTFEGSCSVCGETLIQVYAGHRQAASARIIPCPNRHGGDNDLEQVVRDLRASLEQQHTDKARALADASKWCRQAGVNREISLRLVKIIRRLL